MKAVTCIKKLMNSDAAAYRALQRNFLSVLAETTVYLDGLSLHYPPISDAFDNIEYFSALN